MLSAVLVSLLVSAVAANLQPELLLGENNILRPSSFKFDVYPAANQTASPTQFIAITTWHSTTSCSGDIDIVTGTGVGICFTDGSQQSYIYVTPTEQNNKLSFGTDVYQSKDCSGTKYTTFTNTWAEKELCTLAEGNTGRKYAYSLVNSATPWTTFKTSGVLTQGYYAPASCSSSSGASSAVFTLTGPTNCVLVSGTYPTYNWEKWTACNNGYITKSEYTGDTYCENLKLTSSSQAKLTTCVTNSKKADTESQLCYNH